MYRSRKTSEANATVVYDFGIATAGACATFGLSQACEYVNSDDNCARYASVDYVTGAPEHVFACEGYTPVTRYWYVDGADGRAWTASYQEGTERGVDTVRALTRTPPPPRRASRLGEEEAQLSPPPPFSRGPARARALFPQVQRLRDASGGVIGVGGASLLFKNFNKLLALYTSALGGADVRLFVVESQRGVNASAWPLLAGSLAAISADAGPADERERRDRAEREPRAAPRAGGHAAADQKVRLLYTEGAGNFYYQSRTYDFGGDLPDPWYVVVVQRIRRG